jgi:hypothetical protein
MGFPRSVNDRCEGGDCTCHLNAQANQWAEVSVGGRLLNVSHYTVVQ